MNDANDPIQAQATPDSPTPIPAGFCQQCGKPLTSETIRKVGPAVFCEPCLAARMGYHPIDTGPGPSGAGPVRVGVTWRTGTGWKTAGWTTEELNQPGPNPGLAALLGCIPGVGAMYNEQYAKGIVHLMVFAILCSLASNVNGIFTLFVFGWIFYMAIEAHHTARARRDGTPLPNPFGLNDIGERMGFGKAWPTGPSVAEVASDAAQAAAAAAAQATSSRPPYPPTQTAPPWGVPVETTVPVNPVPGSAAYAQPFVDTAYTNAYRDGGFGTYPGPIPTPGPAVSADYTPIPPAHVAPVPYPPVPARFPAGAVVLIGLGIIFLLTTTGIFNGFPPEAVLGTLFIGFSAVLFLRRFTEFASPLRGDSGPNQVLRLYLALQTTVWPALIGLLFLLDGFDILRWSHSWPFFIILAGVMALFSRAAYQPAAYQSATIPPIVPAPEPAPSSASDESSKGAL